MEINVLAAFPAVLPGEVLWIKPVSHENREKVRSEGTGIKGIAIRHRGRNHRLYCVRLVRWAFKIFLMANRRRIMALIHKLQIKKCRIKSVIGTFSLF